MAFTFKHGDRPLEGYEIQRGVGRGGFGEVYYAISDGGREVALKYLRENPEVELRGISQCINLKSPHLVSIFDVKTSQSGDYFVIMEYISGPSLRDMLIAEPKGLGSQKAAFFLREIAKGLGYLHDRGIVHRDLKPGNIFYEDGYVKICDYGLSKFISVSRHSAQTASIGTVHYMAPEVGSGNYSKTIDIYALGVVFYEMLLGKVPYEGASMGEVLMKHLTQQPEVDELPQPFAGVIRKALAKDPAERYKNVNEMVDAVFDVEDVKQSVRGFEPASLTMVAARVAEDIRPSPVPSDNPAPVARDLPRPGRVRHKAGEFSKRFIERTAGLEAHFTKAERKLAKQYKKYKKKKAQQPELLGKSDQPANVIRSDYHISFGQRLGRLFASLVVAGGLAFAIGAVTQDPALAGVSLGIIMTSVVGIGIGSRIVTWLGPDHPWFISRLFVLIFAAPAASIVYGAIGEGGVGSNVFEQVHGSRDLTMLFIPLLAAFVVFDWRERIRKGLRSEFSIWDATWMGFLAGFGTLVYMSDTHDEAAIWMGTIVGGISLSLQAFAWAMIRNPLPQAATEGRTFDQLDVAAFGTSECSDSRRAGTADGEEFSAEVAESRRVGTRLDGVPAHHLRSHVLRIVAGVLAFCGAMGIIPVSILLGLGEIHGDEETMGTIVGIVAMSLFSLFWLGKTMRVKRVGAWQEWINPILRVVAGTSLATGISGLALIANHGEVIAAFIMVIIVSSLGILFLLFFRQSKGRQLKRYRQGRVLPDRAFDPDTSGPIQMVDHSENGSVSPPGENNFVIPAGPGVAHKVDHKRRRMGLFWSVIVMILSFSAITVALFSLAGGSLPPSTQVFQVHGVKTTLSNVAASSAKSVTSIPTQVMVVARQRSRDLLTICGTVVILSCIFFAMHRFRRRQ